MINIVEIWRGLPSVNIHKKSWIGAALMCLTLPACASTELSQPVKPVIITQDCPRLEIETGLLDIRPLTQIEKLRQNGDLEDAIEVMAADHRRDRGQLIELSAAEKQRVKDQDIVDDLCKTTAQDQAKAIEAASNQKVRVRRPFWKGWF